MLNQASASQLPLLALAPAPSEPTLAQKQGVQNALAKLPLSFEPNRGQAHDEVKFLSRAPGYLLQLTATEARLLIKGPVEALASTEALHPPLKKHQPRASPTRCASVGWRPTPTHTPTARRYSRAR